ncbi:leucine-rich repeat and guanylate kinase domain-containing protein [Microcaecilia unicolor]|uniref:Leucine-rich repeat and guanylate kinase domain-containing protein-like n=1 Tax=Microcaecilia unicolor TaxID=1415580 RepID=A0A6P7Z9I0_9AMPH|nr:leucine-rich repeat and guanylate kinase domain-containing protein-like [Microcaecilia unicolor]
MERGIERQFIEDRAFVIEVLPLIWGVKRPGPHYCLNMKMSQLKSLVFGFEFGATDPRQDFPVTEFPERIVKLDISLNELEELRAESLLPFENLSELDASLNALSNMEGVGAVRNLAVLNLSYNAITGMRGLEPCGRLVLLNISHNQVRTIRDLPLLSSLTQLHLDSNKLKSLEGIQGLPRLRELYVQNNMISSLLPLSSSLALNVLDASNNEITSLLQTLQILRGIRPLKQLKLKGNPLARDNRYITVVKQSTMVEILDNSLLRDPSAAVLDHCFSGDFLPTSLLDVGENKEALKDLVRKSFLMKLQKQQENVESIVHFLHSRILSLQEEVKEFEDSLRIEMEGCIRYINATPSEDFQSIDPQKVPKAMEQHLFTKFWKRWDCGKRRPGKLPFTDLVKPEEVVKAAAQLLSNPPVGTSHEST